MTPEKMPLIIITIRDHRFHFIIIIFLELYFFLFHSKLT